MKELWTARRAKKYKQSSIELNMVATMGCCFNNDKGKMEIGNFRASILSSGTSGSYAQKTCVSVTDL